MISRIKGTQDRLDLRLHNYMIEHIESHLDAYAFDEIATPILEPTELFQRSLGINTDVVSKEMYVVHTGRGEQDMCLRPEATAPTMRAFYNNGIQAQPWRVFSKGPMFRHERPQKGRYRQFHQCNIELINAPSLAHDAQLIAMLDRLFNHTLRFNGYALCINYIGEPEERHAYTQKLREFLEQQPELPKPLQERKDQNILRTFDLKDEASQAIMANAPRITDHLSQQSRAEWEQLQHMLEQLGVSYVVDPTLVRGLDYYNKTVFEFVSDALGAQGTFCGGGRYDYLSQALGERDAIPALGAAIGLERLEQIMDQHREQYPVDVEPPLYVVAPLHEEQQIISMICADIMRTNNLRTQVLFEGASVKSKLRKANKLGARCAILIGEEEQQSNTVRVKDLHSGDERTVPQGGLIDHLHTLG